LPKSALDRRAPVGGRLVREGALHEDLFEELDAETRSVHLGEYAVVGRKSRHNELVLVLLRSFHEEEEAETRTLVSCLLQSMRERASPLERRAGGIGDYQIARRVLLGAVRSRVE